MSSPGSSPRALIDSTNAEVPSFVTQEREIKPVLEQVFTAAWKHELTAALDTEIAQLRQVPGRG